MNIENPLEYARLAIDNAIINERWTNPKPWLEVINALDKAITGQRLTITDVYFAIKGLVYAIQIFPFAESIWIGPHHFIKSEIKGLNLYYANGQENLLLRKIQKLGTVAKVDEERTGWKLCNTG